MAIVLCPKYRAISFKKKVNWALDSIQVERQSTFIYIYSLMKEILIPGSI